MSPSPATNSALPTLPSLPGSYSYPPPAVPPAAGAPYLATSHLPEDFVFIIVGAVIAFVAILIVGWNVATKWTMNRTFKHSAPSGTSYTQLTEMKKHPAMHSSHNLQDINPQLPRSFSSVPSLFFSPTAEVAKQRPPSQHMSAGYMPAGHYRDGADSYRK